MTSLFAFFNLGAQEMVILLIIGVLLFGRKLPEVGRYLGKGIVEFNSREHVQAAVNAVAAPNGYEIHVLRLAPFGSRPELFFTPKVRTHPRR